MSWSEEHKRATRERIVAAAASAIRLHGPDGVSVAAIMKHAGLTHGGFYAHFTSKDELVAAALARTAEETLQFIESTAGKGANGTAPGLPGIADAYLSGMHCEHPERGCALAACGPELARSAASTRTAYSETVCAYVAWLEQHSGAARRTERERQATGALAAMVGGIILARATGDPAGARKVLAAVRRFVRDALERDLGTAEAAE